MGAQEDAERFAGIAEELGLEDGDKEGFINSAMKRKGYKPVTSWADPEPEENENDDQGDFFTNRKKQKEEKQQKQQQQQPPQKKAAGGWQYDD